MLQVRLFRPFSAAHLLAALPASCRAIAVLEQTKEPGAAGEPLYLDVVDDPRAGHCARPSARPCRQVIGGRYGLSSKDFSPAMAKAVFDELKKPEPQEQLHHRHQRRCLPYQPRRSIRTFSIEPDEVVRAVFYGLGSDGTVGANKNSVKIIAEDAGLYAQGYFVYDSHKSGAQTISHLRFGPRPIHAPYLIDRGEFRRLPPIPFPAAPGHAAAGGAGRDFPAQQLRTGRTRSGTICRAPYSRQIIDKKLQFFVIDATRVAQEVGLRNRANTVLQTCFFALSGVLPRDQAIAQIKQCDPQDLWREGRGGGAAEFQRGRRHACRDCTKSRCRRSATSAFERPPAVPARRARVRAAT